jgi:signal transduction histidine kinase
VLFKIQPEEPDRSGLGVALRVCLEQASAEDGLECELEDLTTRRPGQAVRSLLFRAGREALANIRHHAHASHVEMRLQDDARGFSLVVRDDGKGFDAREGLRVRPGHLGLPALRERVELIGGRLTVESGAGAGTVLHVSLPEPEHRNGRGPS